MKRSIQTWRTGLALLLLIGGIRLHAQRAAHWKVYRLEGSYAATLTISPRGNVLVKNGDSHTITWFDGYSRGTINSPDDANFRVYESRTGQLWALYQEGVMLYSRNAWTRYPIAEVGAELRTTAIAALRQRPLIPTELNRVLILLSDRLIDFDADNRRATVLKRSAETSLGKFHEMQEGIEGVWISGDNGVAKIPGSPRKFTPNTPWNEFAVPQGEGTGVLQRPFEDSSGALTVLSLNPEKSTERFLLQLTKDSWKTQKLEGERLREAWPAWDGSVWTFSRNALFRIVPEEPARLLKEPGSGIYFDVATATNGVFWVASSEGFVRYAPYAWRTPTALEGVQGSIHALSFGRRNPRLAWMAGTDGLFRFLDGKLEHFRWPDDFETVFQANDSLYEFRDGTVVITAGSRALLFHPGTHEFERFLVRNAAPTVLGQFRTDGALCLKLTGPGKTNAAEVIHYQEGKIDPMVNGPIPAEMSEATFFFESSNGDMWFGVGSGLMVLREATRTFDRFSGGEGLPDKLFCMAEAPDGKLWAGGMDRLFEFRGRKWEPILSGVDRVHTISRAGDGTMWVGTGSGVYKQTPEGWIRNGLDEGLPAEVIYKVRQDRAQATWAATSRGVAIYHPDADTDSPMTFEPSVQQGEGASTLEPTVISFRGVDKWDYTSAGDLLYSWRLDEGSWSSFASVSTRVFPNLSSGKHRIEVRAMDRNGNKDPSSSTLQFAVIVPWFQDPRLLAVSLAGIFMILFLTGVAVNRHLRLKRSYAEVEQIVAERTTELERANRELLQSQKMKAIGTMAAGIAHDFNNILSIIKGSAQIIETNVENPEKIKTRVNRIQNVVEQGAAIVRALLGLGRLNENEMVACNAGQILEDTRRVLADRFPETVRMQIESDKELPAIICSKEVLQQMLINLILNAVDAISNKGTVLLKASTAWTLPPDLALKPEKTDRYVFLSVTDQGVGIGPESLPRIFEPFYTTKGFSSRRGTGLGLSMVYELAKGMGYGLQVESELGRGSTFSIILPVKRKTL